MQDAPPPPAPIDIEAMLREADVVQFTNYARLMVLAEAVIEAALRENLPAKAAEALAHRAWALIHTGQSEGALRAALDGLIMAREAQSPRAEFLALRALSVVFDRGGLPDETQRLLELQQKIVSRLGEPLLQASTFNNSAVNELPRDPLKAIKLLHMGLAVLPQDGSGDTRRIVISWNMATAMALSGQIDGAAYHAEEALRVSAAIDAKQWAARSQVVLAFIAGLHGDFKAAHGWLDRTQPEVLTLDSPVLTGEFHLRHGMILMEQARHVEAVGALEDAFQVTLDHDLINLQIDVLKSLAQCYERIGDMAGVVNTYKRMTEGVVNQQRRGAELRFAVMKTAFDIDRASIEAQARTSQYQASALQRISHEFRTPLAVIKSSAGLVAQYGNRISPEATRARLDEITSQVQWMTLMMDDIAELLQPEDGEFPAMPFTLDGLAQAVLRDVAAYRLDTGRVQIEADGSPATTLHGTFDSLRRALVQLLTNALKFSSGPVTLRMETEGSAVWAVVRDDGIGIPPAEQALVLRPMYRASNIGEVPGTGMGLALVDKLVKGVGAGFELISEHETGTTATLRWPLR